MWIDKVVIEKPPKKQNEPYELKLGTGSADQAEDFTATVIATRRRSCSEGE